MDIYEYPYIMKLSQIRRDKIKRNLYWLERFREHWASKVYYVVVGLPAFWLWSAIAGWSYSIEGSIDSEFLGTLSGYVIRIVSMIGIGAVVFGLVHSFLVELEILFWQYQQKKQESLLDKKSLSGSSEDYQLEGDAYLLALTSNANDARVTAHA